MKYQCKECCVCLVLVWITTWRTMSDPSEPTTMAMVTAEYKEASDKKKKEATMRRKSKGKLSGNQKDWLR